ncbi:conserved exported hypothetical protein [Vibrio nigripulchritudo SO65]|uniref:hypothetical protein n=1 Tax=Vibrio nigripulchritudo TaxID=28173 RepID=UPI0003B1DA04|nr:hypothetical protein [Vibrio nigripulchritudo]CCN33116.1 conserved exported hypothetical protein [Vibrio nigripulchritudo AM115]CCN67967.1 conserved exported hypothetical protein [Vibrio nigripulchritudo POn4]CCN78253.1 conserved exported hypothetical protein [Vibrio nigripulchritudo SO65]
MLNRYSIAAIALMVAVVAAYVFQFYFNLGYEISDQPSDWVDFGDFFNGLVSPLLSFVSLVLLIQSLNLQNQANTELRAEVQLNHKNEQLRSFETYFFGLIEAQRASFGNFELKFKEEDVRTLRGVCAIRALEDQIEAYRNRNAQDIEIEEMLEKLDQDEHIYNTIRVFYNIVKMITERLSDENQFDETIRANQFQTLISFTEFSQLRLVMICMQFMDYPSADYLKNNNEFMAVLTDLGGGADQY